MSDQVKCAEGVAGAMPATEVVARMLELVPPAAALETVLRMREYMWQHSVPGHFSGTSDSTAEKLLKTCQSDAMLLEAAALLRELSKGKA